MTPKRRKNRFFTPHSPRPRTRTTPAAPTAAHTSTTRRGASKSPERPPRSPACCSRANGVAAPRASAVRRENVGRPKTAPARRPAPLVRARSRIIFPSRRKTPPPAQVDRFCEICDARAPDVPSVARGQKLGYEPSLGPPQRRRSQRGPRGPAGARAAPRVLIATGRLPTAGLATEHEGQSQNFR